MGGCERDGRPAFLVISNAAPNGPLSAKLTSADWPVDVRIDWPSADPAARILPAPQGSLLEAAKAANQMAESLPFATLAPETLVWKLAGLVSLAATGEDEDLDHTFQVGDLPRLFEQLVLQLQDLPLPPSPYRVQQHEPDLSTGETVRLIVGYSGAGKTSWLAQSAQHASGALVYLGRRRYTWCGARQFCRSRSRWPSVWNRSPPWRNIPAWCLWARNPPVPLTSTG